ncbi:LytTR family DNA-binding domain-containing protein [Phenylobacterium terrae]|uniref:LytTR family DNA-binding domain-containing protein n=1 Tax=Phenylobacterium terrae TaxID=2665495 RepID=A0ABW4N8B7_9CAUL
MTGLVANGPFANRPGGGHRQLALHGLGAVALALALASSGAFDSDTLPLARRMLMFGVIAALLVPQASLLFDVARWLLPRRRGPIVPGAVAAAATLVLMTAEIHALKATPVVPYAPDPLIEFALFLSPFILPVSGLIAGLKWAGSAKRAAPVRLNSQARPTRVMSPEASGAIAGWPPEPPLTIQVRDHYLEVRTRRGARLLRGRMSDALQHVSEQPGLQPHRSWWVALDEIRGVDRRGRDLVLSLTDGRLIPVARSRAQDVMRILQQRAITRS